MATRSKTKRRKKEEIAEDWCFVCKDGGNLFICGHKDCLKTYHSHCVGRDDSEMDRDHSWRCNWHFCFMCKKNAKFHCFCCPIAVCGHCIPDADFSVVRGIKGFCKNCLGLALLWEERREVDSDGRKVDFTDRGSEEFLFVDYWELIKKDERLKLEDLQTARNLMKMGRNYKDLDDSDEFAKNELDVMNLTNYEVWEWEADDEYSPRTAKRKGPKPARKKEDSTAQPKKKARCDKNEFIGWGSKSLIQFLETIDVDTKIELAHYAVTEIVMKYVDEKKLRHPTRKKMISCDQYLQSLLGRKLVSKHKVHNLLEAHFANHMVDTDEDVSSSEEICDKVLTQCTTKKKKNSGGIQNNREILRGNIPAIVPENIKLVYLRRSIVEELVKQGDTFEGKVIGSFIRVKSDPNNYMQRSSHQLVQVTGMKLKSDGVDAEFLLQVSNLLDDITIPMLSDSDFTKEECEELHQEMKDGLHKKPTVDELEHKARILREDIIKHWIVKEVALLKNLIDEANEKGWRREHANYVDRRNLLLQPSEQSRLVQKIPEVIVDETEHHAIPEVIVDETEDHAIPEVIVDETEHHAIPKVIVDETEHHAIVANPIITSEIGSDPLCNDPFEEVSGPSSTSGNTGDVCHSSSAGNGENHKVEEITTVQPETQGFEAVCERPNDFVTPPNTENQPTTKAATEVIDLTNDDDEDDDDDENKRDTKICLEGEVAEWYCMGPTGDIRGPFETSILKYWNKTTTHPFLFKVWKIGQAPEDATPMPDAFRSV